MSIASRAIIRHEEIAAMPRLRFVKGCESGIFISRDRDESRFYSQGLCFHDADMDDLTWEGVSWDEAFYCMKGKLRVVVTDAEGNQVEYLMNEGDHFWGPAGYKYTLKATGVESINFWTTAPVLVHRVERHRRCAGSRIPQDADRRSHRAEEIQSRVRGLRCQSRNTKLRP